MEDGSRGVARTSHLALYELDKVVDTIEWVEWMVKWEEIWFGEIPCGGDWWEMVLLKFDEEMG